MSAHPILAGGEWKFTAKTQSIVNPYTGKVAHEVHLALAEDIETSISAAEAGSVALANFPAYQRSQILEKIACGIEKEREKLATLITEETGKPITDSLTEVGRSVSTFKFAAQEAMRIAGDVVPMDTMPIGQGRIGFTRRFPLGPVLGITPFNFPLNLSAHKLAPAVAAGNAMLLKPPPQAPAVCLELGRIALEAGLPPKALSVLPCSNELAESLVRDERIKMVSFTGSDKVGWYLKSIAGKKKVVLELGGNAGVIVAQDADIAWAVKRCVRGAFVHAGQTCISVQRLYVAGPVHKSFLDLFIAQVKQLKAGDPKDPATFLGPMIDTHALDKAEKILKEALAKGARVLFGGKRKDPFFEPTVLENVPESCSAVCEEAFSPLVVIERFENFNDALKKLNSSSYGLQAGVFTQDVDLAMKAAMTIEAGAVLINDVPTYRVDSMPYGGIKDSGLGREGLRYAIEEMTEPKLIIINTSKSS